MDTSWRNSTDVPAIAREDYNDSGLYGANPLLSRPRHFAVHRHVVLQRAVALFNHGGQKSVVGFVDTP